MKKTMQTIFLGVSVLAGSLCGVGLVSEYAHAVDAKTDILSGVSESGGKDSNVTVESTIKKVVNIILYVLGAVCVVMIIVGGILFTTSAGDPQTAKSAKDTILYAVIGLVVATLAYAIVQFTVDKAI